MNVLVIGSGGREHALAWKLKQSPQVGVLACAPGNPGTASIARNVPISPTDIPSLIRFARKENIGLTVVGPEQPLAEGIADEFAAAGLRIFGPTRRASELEWSKVFAKAFMQRWKIPTAGAVTFSAEEQEKARAHIATCTLPVVIKADGLASGKGVLICMTREEATRGLAEMNDPRVFGPASQRLVVEEFMEGEEASVFAVTDGKRCVILPPAQDHKRALDGDLGKNTGGMGAYAPTPRVTPAILRRIMDDIISPTLKGMAAEGRPYQGCLYVGLMLTESGPKVVEYNCRFGDPETQAVLPLYDGDLVDLCVGACDGGLEELVDRSSTEASAVCVVLASGGYPDGYVPGKTISGLEAAEKLEGIHVFHAGTRREPDWSLVTSGGRVLGVTAVRRHGTLQTTIAAAYDAVSRISFEGMHFRRDVGKRALS